MHVFFPSIFQSQETQNIYFDQVKFGLKDLRSKYRYELEKWCIPISNHNRIEHRWVVRGVHTPRLTPRLTNRVGGGSASPVSTNKIIILAHLVWPISRLDVCGGAEGTRILSPDFFCINFGKSSIKSVYHILCCQKL